MSTAARFTTAFVCLASLHGVGAAAEPAPENLDAGCLLNAVGRATSSPEARQVLARAAAGARQPDGLGYRLSLPGLEVRVGSHEGVERIEAVSLRPAYKGPLPAGLYWGDPLDEPRLRLGGEVVNAQGDPLLKVVRGGVEILVSGAGTMRVGAVDVRWTRGAGPYEGEATCGDPCAALGAIARAAPGDFVDVIDPATEQEMFGQRQWSLRLDVPTTTRAIVMSSLGRRTVKLTFARTPARFGEETFARLRGVVETCLPDGYGPGASTVDLTSVGANVTRFTRLGAAKVELTWTQRGDLAGYVIELVREPRP